METGSRGVLGLSWITASVLASVLIVACGLVAQTTHETPPRQPESLKSFLRSYLGEPSPSPEQVAPTRYSWAFVDLKDDGTKEVIVYITGRDWCGTGGCTMLILAPEGASYRVITKVPAVRLPIRMLATTSNGWHDIGIVVRPNGFEPVYEAASCFDGKTYPISPLRRLEGKAPGRTVIPVTTKDEPLYQ